MGELLEIQRLFYSSIFTKEENSLDFISSLLPKERIDVYRATVFENMRNSLEITFPGVWKLLGHKRANRAAHIFCSIEKNLPKTGCLDDFGHEFPEFLGLLKELDTVPYIKDYALYELTKDNACGASDEESISGSDLENIPEEVIDNVKFSFVSSCMLFSSQFPILDIEEMLQNPEDDGIRLTNNPSYAIISRVDNEVCTFWVSDYIWIFVKNLMDGLSFAESSDLASQQNEQFNLAYAISFILQNKFIKKIILPKGIV